MAMEGDIDKLLTSIRDHIKDSSQKTHKMLINNLSALTIHLDRDEIGVGIGLSKKKEHISQIADIVLSQVSYNYAEQGTNLELILRLLSQIILQ